ncbi:MAG: hypothetical protein OXB84_01825, partial [Halobacteriovoraceae bacterium]|nr:hypothetical protein [Halobacteriovoraceae bacterium]
MVYQAPGSFHLADPPSTFSPPYLQEPTPVVPRRPTGKERYPNSFYVERITMSKKAEDELTPHTWINILGRKNFIFRACITDEARIDRHRVREQSFYIKSGGEDFYDETNSEGCLYWEQTFEYLELAEMQYFKLQVEIRGLNELKGTRYIDLGIRPWTNDLRDYRFEPGIEDALQDIAHARKTGVVEGARLIVVNATLDNLTEERRPNYSRYNYRLRINPQFQTRTGKGLQQFPFTNGRFRVHTVMVERDRETLEIVKSFGTASQVADITNA